MRHPEITLAALLLPVTAFADPLDKGEAYTTRKEPPDWMTGVDISWLLVDYGLFALAVIALGWLLVKKPEQFARFEAIICLPFRTLLKGAAKLPILLRELAQGLVGLGAVLLVVAWVILCQWLKHHGFGGLSMAGLALEAVILVRLIKGTEKPLPVQPE
ncbi:MAG TPA: hypothetical protein VKA31_02505 [Mariprofundaceae bacterium]|nr:hypothetical protein [Mariprofundaceae bacterium]